MKRILKKLIIKFFGQENFLKFKYYLAYRDGEIQFGKNILFYPKGYTIIERYFINGNYEPELIEHIVRNFGERDVLNIVDIGANIGLLSSILKEKLEIKKLYLFEPGPLQFKYLNKSFRNIENTFLFNKALGSETKNITFHTHHPIHTSGDGIIDTKRAGKSKAISVQQLSFDTWWVSLKKPNIHILKIDVEGYEYEVLKGAINFIKEQQPFIYLEINILNLKNQAHTLLSLLSLIEEFKYDLFNLEGEKVNSEQKIIDSLDDNFYAKPKK